MDAASRRKDPYATLATFRVIAKHLPKARFIWASPGGADTSAIRSELAADPVLSDRVNLGQRTLAEMPEVYAAADVTMITSEAEVGATVVSESISQGTPVAAFSLPVIRALGDGTAAIQIVPRRDPAELAAAAMDLAARKDLRNAARRHFDEKLSYAAIARDRSRIYEDAVAARSARGWRPGWSRG